MVNDVDISSESFSESGCIVNEELTADQPFTYYTYGSFIWLLCIFLSINIFFTRYVNVVNIKDMIDILYLVCIHHFRIF